jgi:Phage tail tube protein, TTP
MRTPTGTITSVATVLAAAVAFTAITNAAEAVCTSAGHTLVNGDIILVFSGWGKLNYKAFKVKNVAGSNFTLERCNTTNTDMYLPGGGAGTFRKVTTWVDMDRTMNHNSSGGEPKQIAVKFSESDVEVSLNDGFTAVQRSFEMDADMIGTPGYEAMATLNQTQAPTIIRRRAKTGALSLIPGTVAFNEEEIEQEGQIVRVRGTVNGQNTSTRYPA